MQHSTVEAPRLYKGEDIRAIAAALGLFGILTIGGTFSALMNPAGHASKAAVVVGFIFGVLLLLWSILVVARMGVVVSDRGVEVRSWVRHRQFSWDQVEGFSVGTDLQDLDLEEGINTPSLTTYLILRNGERLRLPGIQATRDFRGRSRAKVAKIIVELQGEQRKYCTK